MGNSHIMKGKSYGSESVVEGLKNKVRLLQVEINEIMNMRESESQAYEREMMVFAIKEAEWRKERRRLRGEVKRMRKKLEYIEERFKGMEHEMDKGCDTKGNELQSMGSSSYLLEQIMEEQSRREEAAEKWKQLYFAIKIELDDLIQRTHNQGETLHLQVKENDALEKLQKQVMAKEETIELLQAQVASMEQQQSKQEREVDILRQSLRIMHFKNRTTKGANKLQ